MQEITFSNFVISSHALGQFLSYFLKVKMVNEATIMQPLRGVGRNFSRGGRFKCYLSKRYFLH